MTTLYIFIALLFIMGAFVVNFIIYQFKKKGMPIISIIDQPATNDLKAAYRPVVFKVRASRTDNDAHPPVVYCDIYVNSIYYKTTSKTQYVTLNDTDSDWQFDIQDAIQEVLKSFLPLNGGSVILEAASLMALIYCKFRSSGYDANGFITSEGTAPVQGTGTIAPVAGTGTQSNSFYVVNSTLQHEQNQNFTSHLNFYKTGPWASNVFPLSHRHEGYKVCNSDSDYFPVINLSDKDLNCLVLNYKLKGDNSFSTQTYCPGAPCVPPQVPVFSFERATKDIPYSKTITISGTSPFTFPNLVIPSWLIVNTSPDSITFSGTPSSLDIDTGQAISFDVVNSCGRVSVSKTIDVTETVCIPVAIIGSPSLPDAHVGMPYTYSFGLSGDPDFTIGTITPAWIGAAINQTTKQLTISGTPSVPADGVTVSIEINNCSGNSVTFSDTIDVLANPSLTQISNTDTGPGGVRTQVAQAGETIYPGNKFTVQVYSHAVTYIAIAGDTPTSVATALKNAINATTEAEWNSAESAPLDGRNGFPPHATSSAGNITIVLDYQHVFAFSAEIS